MRDRVMFKGEVQTSPRIDSQEQTLVSNASVGVLFHRMLEDSEWRWPATVFAAHVLGQSVDQIQREGSEVYGRDWPGWRRAWIFRKIQAARHEWSRRVQTAGLC